ncbi:NAD-dependent dehydratase [Candidatus Roizmanbacteria bacterium CG_4_9_14_0_2_um_filter_39_13]|uniref:NAD-dependent dehydratase n=2 Tax=Candidatus Roizmaniibacteriota TaxID=1752723 RepID=A0A2M8F3X2_9BACT|nr:MAG: NAD-dependent dehydratase [Candidatus Roizmanbacteria bacterium CG_4_10_14_0_2_um_filter_39_12]PJC34003.1 MAG: NAD-dependent dehydratase [Candidatus Roizmanbacteria bacterium CG_4_9_14_0_2_um_filter_39_13]PJE62120.1 MAG: NAD-dependent dehydratase [Candidatus Roizmanbacteria bacterium CG10_big_fil_rev_8_21_14_0_10_39_12]
MNILITGGSGFIGSHLSKLYAQKGNNIFIIDNLLTGNRKNIQSIPSGSLIFFEQDLTTFNLTKLPHIDICYHLASPASPVQYKKHPIETMRVNSEGTYRILELCRNKGCDRMVLTSTSEIYGDPLEHPQKESYWGNVNTLGDRACYDEAKRYAESISMTYHRSFDIDVRIARIFNTYGPNMELNDGRVVSNFIIQAIQNNPITIYGDGTQTRSFCYVEDMVSGLVALGETEDIQGDVINLGNPDEKTVLELAEIIKDMTDSTSEISFEGIGEDDPKKRKPDISKAQKVLKWEPKVPLDQGLQKTINYFESELNKQN